MEQSSIETEDDIDFWVVFANQKCTSFRNVWMSLDLNCDELFVNSSMLLLREAS